jgi:HEAT repeat protein
MGRIKKFMKRHPMGLMLLTSALMLAGLVAVVIIYPHWRDQRLLDDLASSDSWVRGQAITDAGNRAKVRPQMRQKLIAALNTEDDTHFFAIVTALNSGGLFKSSVENPLHIDRALAVELATAPDPDTQLWLLAKIINDRKDNRYIRRALTSAAASKVLEVRTGSSLLAALLKDDAILGELLDDEDPAVRAAAALDAGLAGRRTLGDRIVEMLTDDNVEVACNAAAGLAYLDPTEYGPVLCKLLSETENTDIRQRLCHVMTLLNNDSAKQAVRKLLASARGKRPPSPMALLAAGKLALTDAADDVRGVLTAAVSDRTTNRRPVHAAIEAAGALDIPVSDELHKICKNYWNPNWRSELMFTSAVRLLGRQAAKSANRAEYEQLLIEAAYYAHRRPTTGPAAPVQTTPLSSAAAATAFWLLNPASAPDIQLKKTVSGSGAVEFTGRRANGARVAMDAASTTILAGDYIAWHVARSGRAEAFQLGLHMLPPTNAPAVRRIYNENLRGAGATLLALAARTDEQRQIAVQRITERLKPGKTHSGEDDPVLAGRFRCALLILGLKDQLQTVRNQRNDSGHAVPAAFTALLFAGDTETLDYLLNNTHIPPRDIAAYMIYDGLDRVLSLCAPELPAVDTSPDAKIQLWQARIVRDYYVLHRGTFFLGSKR